MNHPQNTKIKSKRYHAIFKNLCGKWPTVSPLLTTLMANMSKQLSNSLSQASLSLMASKYPCKHGSHEQLKKSLKPSFQFALRMNEATTLVTLVFSLLIKYLATKPRYATEQPNELTNFRTCKCRGKVHRGKWSCVQVRLHTFLILVIRIKMRVRVLFRLQIESPIGS